MKAVSKWVVENFKLEWIVENFSFIKGQKGSYIDSPELQINITGGCTKWKIRLYPYGNEDESGVEVYLFLVDTKLDDLMVQCEFVFLNILGEKIETAQFSPQPFFKDYNYGVTNFIKRDNLLNDISDNDNLTIIANLKVSNCVENRCSSTSNQQSSIIDDLAKLRQNADYSDILITVGGREFKAHKNILAARSTVFSSMFQHNMKKRTLVKLKSKI